MLREMTAEKVMAVYGVDLATAQHMLALFVNVGGVTTPEEFQQEQKTQLVGDDEE